MEGFKHETVNEVEQSQRMKVQRQSWALGLGYGDRQAAFRVSYRRKPAALLWHAAVCPCFIYIYQCACSCSDILYISCVLEISHGWLSDFQSLTSKSIWPFSAVGLRHKCIEITLSDIILHASCI